jgi:hypothetical protein
MLSLRFSLGSEGIMEEELFAFAVHVVGRGFVASLDERLRKVEFAGDERMPLLVGSRKDAVLLLVWVVGVFPEEKVGVFPFVAEMLMEELL